MSTITCFNKYHLCPNWDNFITTTVINLTIHWYNPLLFTIDFVQTHHFIIPMLCTFYPLSILYYCNWGFNDVMTTCQYWALCWGMRMMDRWIMIMLSTVESLYENRFFMSLIFSMLYCSFVSWMMIYWFIVVLVGIIVVETFTKHCYCCCYFFMTIYS